MRLSHFRGFRPYRVTDARRIPNMSRSTEIGRLTDRLSVIVRGCLRTDTRIAAARRKARERLARRGTPWAIGVGAPEWAPPGEKYTWWTWIRTDIHHVNDFPQY